MGNNKELIAANIAKYRKLAGYSQKELASLVKVSPSAVSNWEKGKNSIDIDILVEVCRVLGCSLNSMCDYEEERLDLSEKEKELVKAFRRCTLERQSIVLELVGLKRDILTSEESNNKKATG